MELTGKQVEQLREALQRAFISRPKLKILLREEIIGRIDPIRGRLTLEAKANDTIHRFQKAKLWQNPAKKKKFERLLAQMEALLAED